MVVENSGLQRMMFAALLTVFNSYYLMRRFAYLAGINALVFLAGVVVIELLLGGWLHPSRIHMVGVERNLVKEIKLNGLYEWPTDTIYCTRDRWGFRGAPSDPGAIDVLTVGGSTTAQVMLNDGYTWQEVCERVLREGGHSMELANAGIDGQSSFGHIKNFSWWFNKVPKLQPQYILYYIGINDFVKQQPDKFDEMALNAGSVMDFVQENSVFLRAWRIVRGHYRATETIDVTHHRTEIRPEQWVPYPFPSTDLEALMAAHLDAYEERLRTLVRLTREFGAEPILVTQATWWYRRDRGQVEVLYHGLTYNGVALTGMDFYFMMRMLNERTLKVAADLGCPSFDLDAEVDFTEGDFYDYGHNTPAGAERVGIYMARKIGELP